MSFNSLLNKRAVIERSTPARSGAGDITPSWAAVQSSVRCALQPRGGRNDRGIFAETIVGDYIAYFESGVDIEPKTTDGKRDRILVDDIYYSVVRVIDMAGRGKYLKAYLERMQ